MTGGTPILGHHPYSFAPLIQLQHFHFQATRRSWGDLGRTGDEGEGERERSQRGERRSPGEAERAEGGEQSPGP